MPGVEIVSPLVLEDGRHAVLVHRGFMPTPDAVTVQTDSVREFGKVQVEGIAELVGSGNGDRLERGHRTTWARLDLDALSASMPYQLAPVYIRQSPDSSLPRFPRRLEAAVDWRRTPSELRHSVVCLCGDGGGVRSSYGGRT